MAKLLHIQTSHVAVARHRRQWRSKGVARQFREGRPVAEQIRERHSMKNGR